MKRHKFIPLLRTVVYGHAGAGKTTFCGTAAELGPVLHLNAAGNPVSAIQPGYEYVFDVDSIKDLVKVYQFLVQGQKDPQGRKVFGLPEGVEFKVVVLDTITEMQRLFINEHKAWQGELDNPVKMEIQDWGVVLQQMTNFTSQYFNLPLNVIMVAQEKAVEDKATKMQKYQISLQGDAQNIVPAHAQQVVRLSRANNKTTANLVASYAYYAKIQGIDNVPDKVEGLTAGFLHQKLQETFTKKLGGK